MQATQTLESFIAEHEITMDTERTDANPNMAADAAWMRDASHWLCTLQRAGQSMPVPFSQGSAHHEPPTTADVLDCLASDASSVANEPDWFEWAQSMGYDDGMALRGAREAYAEIERQSEALRDLIGPDAFETLLYNVDRL